MLPWFMPSMNRLGQEASPYLQQHAHNPVDWYPWGDEALGRAKRDDRPILLSIGYSACHWCHVMERESFEDAQIAKLMNEWFVNIKVDREERPDLDQVYQLTVQLMGRSGGWPLTVFLTPDQKPFFAGTYFPPVDRYGMPGFPKVLQAVWEACHWRGEEVCGQAAELSRVIDAATTERGEGDAPQGRDLLARAAVTLGARFDDTHGGFGARPKFPSTMALDLLQRRAALDGDEQARARVKRALDGMLAGGVYDQLGGGFHRYSTDERWLVPHFEKMLYDNALLLRLYADGFRATGDARYAECAREIAAYVAREMTSPEGAFYATQDADSEGEEGRFFVWDPEEIDAALAGDDAAAKMAKTVYGVTPHGNFEESGKSVLSLVETLDAAATKLGLARPVAEKALARARARLFEVRDERVKPFRDEKVLASWNGLMIGALANASLALGETELAERAERAFAFVEKRLMERQGAKLRVLRHAKGEVVKGPGFLDDHAFVADAAIDLYEATGNPRYVAVARAIADAAIAHFWDGGFYFTPDDGEKLIVRPKDVFDHAVPSATSIACKVLLRLGTLAEPPYLDYAEKELARLAGPASENPFGMSQTVALCDRLARGGVEVVIAGSGEAARTLGAAAARRYVPDLTLAWLVPGDRASLEACAQLAEGKSAAADGPRAYVCKGRSCSLPLAAADAVAQALATPATTTD